MFYQKYKNVGNLCLNHSRMCVIKISIVNATNEFYCH